MKKTDTVFRYGMLAVAFLIGLAVAIGTSQAFGHTLDCTCPAVVTATTSKVTVTRTVQPRLVFAQPVRPVFTVVQAPAPTYTIVETPRAPFVVNGLFRDRVVQPRRSNLSIIAQ